MTDDRAEVARKLHPARIRVSPSLTALLAYLLQQVWVLPQIVQIQVTADGILNVQTFNGDTVILGTVSDLQQNVRGLVEAAGLTAEERDWLLAQIPPPGASGPYWNPCPLRVRPADPIEWLS